MTVTALNTELPSLEVRTGPDGAFGFDPDTGESLTGPAFLDHMRRAVAAAIVPGPPAGEPRPHDTRVRRIGGGAWSAAT